MYLNELRCGQLTDLGQDPWKVFEADHFLVNYIVCWDEMRRHVPNLMAIRTWKDVQSRFKTARFVSAIERCMPYLNPELLQDLHQHDVWLKIKVYQQGEVK